MRMSRIVVIIAIAVFVSAISTSIWQGVPTHQVTATNQPSSGQFVSAASASEPSNESSPLLTAAQKREQVANCNNPIVRDTRKFTHEEQDAFVSAVTENATALKRIALDKAVADTTINEEQAAQEMADFTANTLPAIREQAQASAPAEEVIETIFVDDPEAIGEAPSAEQDPDGTKTREFAEKVKEAGCKAAPFHSTGGRLAAPAAATYTAGTKSCTNSHTLKNSVGGTLAKVTQTSSWYSNSSGLPSNPRKSYSTTAGWGWDEKGAVQGEGPTVTVKYNGVPLQYYSWTGQNFHFEHLGLELYTWYGEVEHWFGYSNQYGPRCSIRWWYP